MKTYRYNTKTRQIHRMKDIIRICNAGTKTTAPVGANWKKCRWLKAWILLILGYDACGHCWPKMNKGK